MWLKKELTGEKNGFDMKGLWYKRYVSPKSLQYHKLQVVISEYNLACLN